MGGSVGSVGSEGVGNNGVVFTYMYISPPQLFCIFGGVDKETIIFASSFLL